MILLGTIVNVIAILLGSAVGLFGSCLFPERMKDTLLYASALCAMGMGIPGLMGSNQPLVPIISLVVGTLIGELLNIDGAVNSLGERLQKKFSRYGRITEGFVMGSLVFPIGAMSVLGALNSGLTGDHTLLYAKSVMDGISSVVFASTLGIGVAFSSITTFVIQGAIALMAGFVAPFLSEAVLAEVTFTGSLLIVAISLNLLGATKIKVLNMIPSLLLAVILGQFI